VKRIYLDHNATTRPAPEVVEAMLPFLREDFGNPSSIHWFGQQAHRALDRAREQAARLIGAAPDEIVFTSGGTEADNHALRGVADAPGARGRALVTSAIEHHAILAACRFLESRGTPIVHLGVDETGLVDPAQARAALAGGAALVSVMLANNDVGTVEPVAEIAAAARERGALSHTDAVQAVGKIPVNVAELGVDLLSFSSHKIYGPKGVGALYVRRGAALSPLLFGGSHEGRRRGGTENVPGIVGFGNACELAAQRLAARAERAARRRDRLQQELLARFPAARVNGHATRRLPNTLNITFPGLDNESLLLNLDLLGVAASAGSACASGSREPSHVLVAMGRTAVESRGSLRFSFGEENEDGDVDRVVEALASIVARLAAGEQTA
jgi:cysteine desulfurase